MDVDKVEELPAYDPKGFNVIEEARGDSRQIFEILGIEFGAQRASPWENEVRLVFVLAVSGESSIGKSLKRAS
jgi:hypothetical protein